jgi:hypothetical protein
MSRETAVPLQTMTRWRTLCINLRQSPGHRRLPILGMLWLVSSVWNWWMALYVLSPLVILVRQRPGVRCGFVVNLLLGWTVVGWLVGNVLGHAAERCPIPPGSGSDAR